MTDPRHNIREVRAPRGDKLNAKDWLTEAPLRMLMNNLDPDVAENPNELVVYGGVEGAARRGGGFAQIGARRVAGRHSIRSSRRCASSMAMRRCWCSPASRSGFSKPIGMRRAC